MARLQTNDIIEITKLIKDGKKISEIAKQFNVSTTSIYAIKNKPERSNIEPIQEVKEENKSSHNSSQSSKSTKSKKSKKSKVNSESSESSESISINSKESTKKSTSETESESESETETESDSTVDNRKIINIQKDNNSVVNFIDNDDNNNDSSSEDDYKNLTNKQKVNKLLQNTSFTSSMRSVPATKKPETFQNNLPQISKNLMVSQEYQKKRSLILVIRSYIEMFYDSKPGIKILINVHNKDNLPIFNAKLFDLTVDELEKLKSNIQFEINVNENSSMVFEFAKSICYGYEKFLTSLGYDITSFTDSLFKDKMFTDNLKLLSCEFNFSEYLSPSRAMILAVLKQTFIIHKINQIKSEIVKNDPIIINDNLSKLNQK